MKKLSVILILLAFGTAFAATMMPYWLIAAQQQEASAGGWSPTSLTNLAVFTYYSELGDGQITQWTNHAPSGIALTAAGSQAPMNRILEGGLWFDGADDAFTLTPGIPLASNMLVALAVVKTNIGINVVGMGIVGDGTPPYAPMHYAPDNKPYIAFGNAASAPGAYTNLGITIYIAYRIGTYQCLEINGVLVSSNFAGSLDPRNYAFSLMGRRGSRFTKGPHKALIVQTNTPSTPEQRLNIKTYMEGLP